MSVSHSVRNYDAKKSVALDGQRLAKIVFKTTANQKAVMPSKCVSVPVLQEEQIAVYQAELAVHVHELLEGAQNELIRAKLLEHGTGEGVEILDSDISVLACINWLDEAAKGNRLSKDSITAWFNGNVAELLSVAIADKLGISDTPSETETVKLNKIVSDYCEKFAALSGSKTYYAPEIATRLIRALEVAAPAEDKLTVAFTAKLEAMKVKPAADLLAL